MKVENPKSNNPKKRPKYILDTDKQEDILEGEVVDLRIVNEARETALKSQEEVLKVISSSLVSQLNFDAPILATAALRDSTKRMHSLNDSLLAYKNVFSGLADSLRVWTSFGEQINKTLVEAFNLHKTLVSILNQPYLLPSSKNQKAGLTQSETERALRHRVSELESELEHYLKIVSEPPQKALPTPNQPVIYDKGSKTIFIKDTEVLIDTSGRSYNQTEVCDMLFKNKTTIRDGVSNMLILERLGHDNVTASYVRENWRIIYNIVQGINRKISDKTFAPKYIQCRTTWTRINKLYLK